MMDRSARWWTSRRMIEGDARIGHSTPPLTDGEAVLLTGIIQVIRDNTWCAGGFDEVELEDVAADMTAMLIGYRSLVPGLPRPEAEK